MKRGKIVDSPGKSIATERGAASFEQGIIQNWQGCPAGSFPWQGGGGGFMGTLGGPQGGLPGYSSGGSPQQLSDTTSLFTNLRWYLISNFRQVLTELYVEIGLIQTIVNVPVDDALRGGITIKSKQLYEPEIEELKQVMQRHDDMGTIGWAAKWTRLFGGGGILVIADDQDPETPLEVERISEKTDLTLRAVDMWELFWSQQNIDEQEYKFEKDVPALEDDTLSTYDYYTVRVHKSRVMKIKGPPAPSFIRPRLRGWGVSVVEALVRSINQYLKAADLTYEVLDEFKVDVYKIKDLVNTLLNPQGQSQVFNRLQFANWQKDYQNALIMDAEDDWDHKQLSFAGLAEVQGGIRKQVAADLRMPITKLFGSSDSTASIGTADQNDMENYNSMVESEVREKIRFDILRVVELRCQQTFGMIPDDLEIEFEPLRVLSAEQEENVKDKKWTRISAAKSSGDITTIEFRDACNKGNIFDIKLDTTDEALNAVEDEKQASMEAQAELGANDDTSEEPGENTNKTVGGEDPGANRPDRRGAAGKSAVPQKYERTAH